ALTHASKGAKGSLAFTIQNTGNFPLKVTSLSEEQGTETSTKDYFDSGLGASVPCAAKMYFNDAFDTSSWPVLAPGASLYVDPNGSDSLYPAGSWVSGAHMIGLDADTSNECMGSQFSVPVQVHATDAS